MPGLGREGEFGFDGHLYRFGRFVLDSRKRTLLSDGAPVALTPKAFDLLLFFAQHPNRPIAKEELLQAVWGRRIVEEGNLAQYISHLRKALGENPEHPGLIATIARKGYQFTGDVLVADTADVAAQAAVQTFGGGSLHANAQHPRTLSRGETFAKAIRRWQTTTLAATALLAALAAIFWLHRSYHRPLALAATDTVVLADLNNQSGDPVFDDALTPVLRSAMEQTPYLNILDNDKTNSLRAALSLPKNAKIDLKVAQEMCLRSRSNMVISPSIADAGNRYRLELRAIACDSGQILAELQGDVEDRNDIVHQLGVIAARFRAKLGEPADILAKFNQPLDRANSASLEALQDTAQATKLYLAGDPESALALFQRVVELDPDFALNHQRLGAAYLFLGKTDQAVGSYTRTYELRDRLTERSRLGAEVDFYTYAIGDIEKGYLSALHWRETYPHDLLAHIALRNAFLHLGQPERGADEADEIARLRPSAYYFGAAIQSNRFAGRFNEAKALIAQSDAQKFDNSLIRRERLIVAFAMHDTDRVEEILKVEEQGKYREDFLFEHSLIEIQQGRFQSAERLRRLPLEQGSKPRNGHWWLVLSALENAEVGKDDQVRSYEREAGRSDLDGGDKLALALALARSGGREEAGRLADSISTERPEDTLVQKYFVPTIRAAIKLHDHDSAAAIELLRGTVKYDLAFTDSFNYVYPAYVRGLAYLDLGDGKSAAAQFQKVIDNPGFGVRHVIWPLAWLQLGRARKMMGDEATARKSYETFLDLWKNADPDIPVYEQAKAEYSILRK